MTEIKQTGRKGLYQKNSWRTKRGKRIAFAQLCDIHGLNIRGAVGQYTMLAGDSEESGMRTALLRAFEKLDSIMEIEYVKPQEDDHSKDTSYFTTRWKTLTDEEKTAMVGESHSEANIRKKIVNYFERNMLPKLDRYGQTISADDAKAVAKSIYLDILNRKKYGNCFVSELEAVLIPEYIHELGEQLASITEIKRSEKEQLDNILNEIQATVMREDRIRSLLQSVLSISGLDTTLKMTTLKIKENPVLIDDLCHLTHTKPRTSAMEALLEMIREVSGDENRSKAEANVHIRDTNDILRNWVKRSEVTLPLIQLPEFNVPGVQQIEICKELPWAVCVRFAALEMAESAISPYACGALTMLTTGPRVAETCAIRFGDILDYGDWGIVTINYTADGEIRIGRGKNSYFHRAVFLPRIVMDAIHTRMDYLRTIGYLENEIKEAYLACSADDIFRPANLHLFSDSIKEMLQQAGCDEGYWRAVVQSMTQEPDYDVFGRREMYDTAYCLRRNATTQCVNKAKMPPLLVDAILGHRLPRGAKRWDAYITEEDNWKGIVAMLERVVYDPRHSNHPAYRPVDLGTETNERLEIPYQAVSFTVSGHDKVHVQVAVKTIIGSTVSVTLPVGRTAGGTMIRLVGEKEHSRKTLLSETLRDESEYRKIVQQMRESYDER